MWLFSCAAEAIPLPVLAAVLATGRHQHGGGAGGQAHGGFKGFKGYVAFCVLVPPRPSRCPCWRPCSSLWRAEGRARNSE